MFCRRPRVQTRTAAYRNSRRTVETEVYYGELRIRRIHKSEVSKETVCRFVFVCIGGAGRVQKAEYPLASQICFDWGVYSCCIAWARKGLAEVKQPNSYFSSLFPSVFLLSCLLRNGSQPASCIIKPFIYTLLTDATSSLGWGNTVCFSNLWERLNSTAG